MRTRAAEKQSVDRRAVLRPAKDRPHGEELIERRLTVIDLSAGQSIRPLEIHRREDLCGLDGCTNARGVLLERAQDGRRQFAARVVPTPSSRELVRHEL